MLFLITFTMLYLSETVFVPIWILRDLPVGYCVYLLLVYVGIFYLWMRIQFDDFPLSPPLTPVKDDQSVCIFWRPQTSSRHVR